MTFECHQFCCGTLSWIDPVEELIGILLIQARPCAHMNIRQGLQLLVHQATLEPTNK